MKRAANKKQIDRKVYTNFRNELTTKFKQAKTKYFKDKFEEHSKNIKKTWEVINSIIRSKKVYPNVSLTDDEGKKQSESVIPDKFSDYFTNIANQLTSQIPPSQYTAESFLQNRIQNNFVISPISPIEVNSIIDDLKNNGNTVNSIATHVLEESKHIITPIICHLINLFVQQGYFPDNLKLGCITPIFKNGDKKGK